MSAAPVDAFSQPRYAEARDKFFAARAGVARPRRRDARRIRCPAATARCWRWTSPATAPPNARSLLIVSSACHGVEGFCGSRRAGRAARRRRRGTRPRPTPASPCSTSTASTPTASRWWRRTTHENVDLNRNFHDFAVAAAGATPPTTSSPRCSCPRRWPPDAATVDAIARFVAEHGAKALPGGRSRGGQYDHPHGLFYGGDAPTWSHPTLRQVLRDHGTRCSAARLDRPAHRPRPERPRRAHLRRPRRRRRATRGPRRGGGATPVTSIYDGSSTSALLTGMMLHRRLRGMPAGRVHRHGAGVRHPADHGVMHALRADQWLEHHPEADDATAPRDQAADARRLLHRHRRVEGQDRRAGGGRLVRRGPGPRRREQR